MIDPALDVWVWLTFLVLLGVLGARAWMVETGQGRRARARVQVLTGTAAVVVVALVALLTVQGGALLVEALVTGTDPFAGAPPRGPVDDAGGRDPPSITASSSCATTPTSTT